jgi:hypothetical protein
MHHTAIQSLEKSVFEMSADELRERITPTAEKAFLKTVKKNGYITYFDELLCPTKDYMIHEYRDHKDLVLIGDNGETEYIKTL